MGRRGGAVLPGADRLLPPARYRANATAAGRTLRFRARRRDPARHVSTRTATGRQETQGADSLGGVVLLADAVLPVLPDVSALRLQSVSYRGAALLLRF